MAAPVGGAGKGSSVLPALPYGGLHRPGSDSRTLMDPGPAPIDFGMDDWDTQFAKSLSTERCGQD